MPTTPAADITKGHPGRVSPEITIHGLRLAPTLPFTPSARAQDQGVRLCTRTTPRSAPIPLWPCAGCASGEGEGGGEDSQNDIYTANEDEGATSPASLQISAAASEPWSPPHEQCPDVYGAGAVQRRCTAMLPPLPSSASSASGRWVQKDDVGFITGLDVDRLAFARVLELCPRRRARARARCALQWGYRKRRPPPMPPSIAGSIYAPAVVDRGVTSLLRELSR
ncbi:hypothetical protein C8R47DRAFT_1221467 [Mycena vitilis]|nr:hypothetical protein C8R47DRAFT_1221467 [Mycena vitilis]